MGYGNGCSRGIPFILKNNITPHVWLGLICKRHTFWLGDLDENSKYICKGRAGVCE
jgi:hypothetical protein